MAYSDCPICDQLKAGCAGVSASDTFYTMAVALLCEIAAKTGGGGTGVIAPYEQSGVIYIDSTPHPVQHGKVSLGATGDVIAAGTGALRILSLNFVSSADVNLYITSGAGGVELWGGATHPGAIPAQGGIVLPRNEDGWFQTAAGQSLRFNLSAAAALAGSVTWIEV